jgi:tetratricopeptide (TPR) repeat protein
VTPREKAPKLHDLILERVVELTERTRGRALAAARMLQGIHYLERESFDQSLIAFLESGRLYEEAGDLVGLARSKHFSMLTQLKRDNFKNAIEAGRQELELRRELRDFEGLARAYERLANAFSTRDARKNPRLFLRAARGVLSRGYRIQRARGDFGKASKSLFVFASFLQRFGKSDQAKALFNRAVAFGLASTRFDIAALSHLYLGLLARRNNDRERFQREIRRAKLLAPLADDPRVQKTIERALEPKSNPQKQPPTQLL